jgi:hypothetical protein
MRSYRSAPNLHLPGKKYAVTYANNNNYHLHYFSALGNMQLILTSKPHMESKMAANKRIVIGICVGILITTSGLAQTDQDQEQRIRQLEEQVSALTEAVEESAGTGSRWERIHFGGYGELHYNNLSLENGETFKEIDFHRFVLLFGYDFTERLRFYSELELEHALVEDTDDGSGPGELELEQAYVQYDITDSSDVLGGIFLLPVGILNETHEPTTFYGVERNNVENIIIPATWWEAGAMYTQRFGEGFRWDFAIHSGLDIPTEGTNAFRVRSGRQKAAEAKANDLAGTTRLRYTGLPGLEAAVSAQYQGGLSQGSNRDAIDDGWLFEGHLIYNAGPYAIRALYARWDINGTGIEAADADTQTGWYIEPSVKPFSNSFLPTLANKVGFYFRYEDIDAARTRDRFSQWETGFNIWPHPDVVIKFDYRDRSHDLVAEKGRDFTGFDIGIGYQF